MRNFIQVKKVIKVGTDTRTCMAYKCKVLINFLSSNEYCKKFVMCIRIFNILKNSSKLKQVEKCDLK